MDTLQHIPWVNRVLSKYRSTTAGRGHSRPLSRSCSGAPAILAMKAAPNGAWMFFSALAQLLALLIDLETLTIPLVMVN